MHREGEPHSVPISRLELVKLILDTNGRIFVARFMKRHVSTLRVMRCRLDVSKFVTGEGRTYEFEEKRLIPVYDIEKRDYRVIAIEGLVSATINGKYYVVED